jgi:hypothetical protein
VFEDHDRVEALSGRAPGSDGTGRPQHRDNDQGD